jgi:hypothetical protein
MPLRSAARTTALAAAVLVTASIGRPARADTVAPSAEVIEKDKTPARNQHSYFEHAGPERFFVSGELQTGPFLKPVLEAGWGKPHWAWVGVEAYPMTSWSFGTVYGGVHGNLPFLDAHAGFRDNLSYGRTFLQPADRFTAEDVSHEVPGAPHARYSNFESAARLTAPVPGGYALAQGQLTYLLDVPRGVDLYEENLRVVVRAPTLFAGTLAYMAEIGHDGFLKIGVAGELLVVPARDGARTWRVGPAGQAQITDHTDLTFGVTVPVASRDDLGVVQGSFGMLSLEWQWASGDPHPRFP